MRNGDFSEINRVIYDSQTGQPFPGNIIPRNRFDPASANIITQLYPEPNTAGTIAASGQNLNNYLINPTLTRNDDQGDIKVDHVLTNSNRMFFRYSNQKTKRDLPANLPHGDAGATFGAGLGNIDAQSMTFNDTHTFGSGWLNEFRFGVNQIKFFMTPIDYGTNPAAAVGIPGINLNEATSAMTQLTFQNIRNLGANGNQPLITNQNDLQFFDNVTWLKGRHTLKAGGSVTLRSREILNADTIVGNFAFNNNQTSNCAGLASGCTINTATGFDVASFLLGYAASKTRNLFDADTYTEQRPEYALYVQDDFRVTNKLTLNVGLRWDVYVPWIEKDNRQSNFDEATGRFIVASRQRGRSTASRSGATSRPTRRRDLGPRIGMAYDVRGDGAHDRARRLRRLLELHARRHLVVEGAEPALPAVDGADDHGRRDHPPRLGRPAAASRGRPEPSCVGHDAVDLRRQLPRRLRPELERQRPAGVRAELRSRARLRRLARPADDAQGRPQPGAARRRRHRPEPQPSLRHAGAGPAQRRPGSEHRHARLPRPAREVPAALRRQLLDSERLHVRQVARPELGQRRRRSRSPTSTTRSTTAVRPTTTCRHTLSTSVIYELPIGREAWWGGWQTNGILYLRSGLPLTITQTNGVQSTGTGNRPNRIGDGLAADPTIAQWFDPSAFVSPTDLTGTYGDSGRGILRGPGQFNIDASVIKGTKFGKIDTEFRVEAFNILNHPQFGNPNTTFGNAAFGQITAMLANPSCALCGTTERNVQIAFKIKF